MIKISEEAFQKRQQLVASMESGRTPFWNLWRDLANFILPKRYQDLTTAAESRISVSAKNPNIIDGTGTEAARTCASGMMNGKTSPARPWFRFGLKGFNNDESYVARVWLDEVERRMYRVLAESNFYNALATMYMDIVVFGTSAMLIYEDVDDIIRCYNSPLGEFYLGLNNRLEVCTFVRQFNRTVRQIVDEWGIENVSESTKLKWQAGGSQLNTEIGIVHLVEPNDRNDIQSIPSIFSYREMYWEVGTSKEVGQLLALEGFYEVPGIFPRWDVTGNDAYGTSPGMDSLGDIIQLQVESKRKAQALDYQLRPPTQSDLSMQGKSTAFLPGTNTFVPNLAASGGVRPIYQVNPNLQDITTDIRDIQGRIRETFYNDLFRMISQLETVRSATEIDARREEKLILLGPVLERLDVEAFDKGLSRVYGIMNRNGLIPPAPPEIANAEIEIQYISILSAAQSAVGVAPTERWLQLIGNLAAVYPAGLDIPNFDELLRDYGRAVGVKAKQINPPEVTDQIRAQKAQQAQQAAMAEQANQLSQAGKNLSETDVGGGANALQALLG